MPTPEHLDALAKIERRLAELQKEHREALSQGELGKIYQIQIELNELMEQRSALGGPHADAGA
jgi:hypothetical protein